MIKLFIYHRNNNVCEKIAAQKPRIFTSTPETERKEKKLLYLNIQKYTENVRDSDKNHSGTNDFL